MMVEIDYNALVESIKRSMERRAIVEFIKENADDDHTAKVLIKHLDIFEQHGIGAFEALKIMKEIGDVE